MYSNIHESHGIYILHEKQMWSHEIAWFQSFCLTDEYINLIAQCKYIVNL